MFLSSGDDLSWAESRAAWVRRRVPAPSGNGEWLVLDVDPPAPGLGPPISVVVAAPRHPDERLGAGEPVHVHLLVPRDPAAIDGSTIDPERLEHAAWGVLYGTAEEARERYESLREADEATR
jgi:hypothetical protein